MAVYLTHILLVQTLISFQIVVNGLNENQILRRLQYIEERLDTENAFRREDTQAFISKLEKMETLLQRILESKAGDSVRSKDLDEVDTEDDKPIRGQSVEREIRALRKAFSQEKVENLRFRREANENIQDLVNDINKSFVEIRDDIKYSLEQVGDNTKELASQINNSFVEIRDDFKYSLEQVGDNINEITSQINKSCVEIRDNLKFTLNQTREDMRNNITTAALVIGNMDRTLNASQKELTGMFDSITHHISDSEQRSISSCSLSVKLISDTLTSLLTDTIVTVKSFQSCGDILNYDKTHKSGLEYITTDEGKHVKVYCDMKTDGGGWIVFQRRKDGSVEFNRTWAEYKSGFGELSGEFWLGNEYIHLLTKQGKHELRIDMEDFGGHKAYAKYSEFKLGSEAEHYRLYTAGFSGDAGDSLGSYHNNVAFSTTDKDVSLADCTQLFPGGWWFDRCFHSNLNGKYSTRETCIDGTLKCIHWYHWRQFDKSLKFIEMKFR